MPDIDIYSIAKVTVGKTIPSPAAKQLAELLDHDTETTDFVRGRVYDFTLSQMQDYVLVWFKDSKKWGKSHRLDVLQKRHLQGE